VNGSSVGFDTRNYSIAKPLRVTAPEAVFKVLATLGKQDANTMHFAGKLVANRMQLASYCEYIVNCRFDNKLIDNG
jgi:hypothetical protein